MPAQRLSMRHVTEVLRLKWGCGLSERKIAHSCGISRPTVAEYVRRAQAAGLSWPLPEAMDEATLDRLLFPARPARPSTPPLVPDWSVVHQELKRQGVTVFLLWQEYKAALPEGYQYSWFCRAYQAWAGQLDLVMRQPHRAGEKLFVDYAGQGLPVVNSASGEVQEAAIFIAVLGASNYTYAEATWGHCQVVEAETLSRRASAPPQSDLPLGSPLRACNLGPTLEAIPHLSVEPNKGT